MSMVWLIEALNRKRRANELANEPTDIGSSSEPVPYSSLVQRSKVVNYALVVKGGKSRDAKS